ncbi:MAG: glycosyltransferase family 9 protein [Candidatus Electryonea clarkiae]|nr:glycosyltransferase family 9 protein [Candidatus Electryonea clarkiae]MDP8285649.1 glycosyltransferase family 9 protein [Candidatus Electryonea clarkiae]
MIEERIIIVQLARFGDLIQTSPLIRNLKYEPGFDREITLLVDNRTSPVANMLYGVDNVVGINLDEIADIVSTPGVSQYKRIKEWVAAWKPSQSYDRLILLNHGILTATIASLVPARIREGPLLGEPLPRPHLYLTSTINDRHFNPLHLSEIWAAYGPLILPLPTPKLKSCNMGTALAISTAKGSVVSLKTKGFAVNVGSGGHERNWSAAKLAVLIDQLIEGRAERVTLLGTENDCSTAEKVISAVAMDKRAGIINLCGITRIEDLPVILENCEVLISSDTGTLQLAAATSIQTVGLFFGGANPHETGVFKPGAVALMDSNSLGSGQNNSDNISPESVAKIALDLAFNDKNLKGNYDSSTFTTLVARSASVAPEYRSLEASKSDNMAWERRRTFARKILWGEKILQYKRKIEQELNGPHKSELVREYSFMNTIENTHTLFNEGIDCPVDSAEGIWYQQLIKGLRNQLLQEAEI